MSQRRILYLTPEPWPTFRADVATLVGRELPRCGITSDLVTARDDSVAWQPWTGGEPRLCRSMGGRFAKHVVRTLHAIRWLARARASRYDAIQVRDMPVMAALALAFGAVFGLPVIYWMSYPISRGLMLLAGERRREGSRWNWLPTWVRGFVGQMLLERWVLRRAAFVIVQSERMRDELVELGVPADRLLPVPMGVDVAAVDRALQASPEPGGWPDRTVVGYLGTLDRPRRIDVLLEMAALLRKDVPDLMLVLVGDTGDAPHRQRLEQHTDKLALRGHVHITGWLPTAEAWRMIRRASVALSPVPRGVLLDCSSPTKVAEYLALGIPVVCNDNPDQQQLIEASAAGTCVPLTADAFASAVLSWLEMAPAERSRRAEAGRSHVLRCRDYPRLASMLADEYVRRLSRSHAR